MRLFAALRERAGSGSVELELPDGAVVADVWGKLGLGEEPEGLLYALNRGYAEKSAELSPGDEVAVIPPVSGGERAPSGSEPQIGFFSPRGRCRSRTRWPRCGATTRAR